MAEHDERRILLGVTGGIAAYKAPDLVRRLRERGCSVQVVMSDAATRFVSPVSLQAVAGHPVRTTLWDEAAEAAMSHIELARWADRILVAPATADFLARLAHGFASDLLTTLCLATDVPIAVAPAMNRLMWANAATRDNLTLLKQRGIDVLGPAVGEQACGETGPGRMLEPDILADLLLDETGGALAGLTVMITAGPTREPIDPVRYITNRSSGKMGYALAAAARAAGARVRLVSGPVRLDTPAGVERVDVETAEEMYRRVHEHLDGVDIFIGAAAISDYRPERTAEQKIKKTEAQLKLTLAKAPDTVRSVAALEPGRRPFTVGFAAETERVEEHARNKLADKRLDMIIANQVGVGRVFDQDENEVTVLWAGGGESLGPASKRVLARRLVTLIGERYRARSRSDAA